jgi:hypothetical protein
MLPVISVELAFLTLIILECALIEGFEGRRRAWNALRHAGSCG